MATTYGIVTPDYPGSNSNVPAATLTMAESLRGRIVRTFASTSDRDTEVAALPAAARQGAIVYTSARGWQGYTSADASYSTSNWNSFERVKGGYQNGIIEGNGNLRIPSAVCFFDGAPPTSIVTTWAGPAGYTTEFGSFDGAGALIRCYNITTGQQILNPNAAAVFWIAFR